MPFYRSAHHFLVRSGFDLFFATLRVVLFSPFRHLEFRGNSHFPGGTRVSIVWNGEEGDSLIRSIVISSKALRSDLLNSRRKGGKSLVSSSQNSI